MLLGKQTATVYKPIKLEADAAVELAIALLKGETPTADQELEDGTPYIAVTPVLVGPEQVVDVVDAGDADAAELCPGEVAANVRGVRRRVVGTDQPGPRVSAARPAETRGLVPSQRPASSATLRARQRRRKEAA